MPVKEIENLNRDFSAVFEAVSKLGRCKFASLSMGSHIGGDAHHFISGQPQKEMVMRHLIRPTHPPGELKQPSHLTLRASRSCSDVAHSGWTKPFRAAEQRCDEVPSGLVFRSESDLMRRQSDERAIQDDLTLLGNPLQSDGENLLREPWLQHKPQPFSTNALEIRIFGVVGSNLCREA